MRTFEFEDIRAHCLKKRHVTEAFPFDESTCVWKVDGKLFALADIDVFQGITIKCEPERAIELREAFEGVIPGYHTNKRHWNTIQADADVDLKHVLAWIDHSYERVVDGFSKKRRQQLGI